MSEFKKATELTMLDYFAAKAMQAILTRGEVESEQQMAKASYLYASYMMEMRDRLEYEVATQFQINKDEYIKNKSLEDVEVTEDDCKEWAFEEVEINLKGVLNEHAC